MGARGNSGVILSQIVRGAAESLAQKGDLAGALRSASDAAYRAVPSPVEGTMLTAIRELAEAAEAGGDLPAVVARGDDCVVRTREMLPVLTEAGVVDAGAAGLVELVRGIASAYCGRAAAARAAGKRPGDRRRDPPGALALPLLHRLRRRRRGSRRAGARARARDRSATRCSSSATARRSRSTCTPTIPAARCRSPSPSAPSAASRSRTCTSRRASARRGSPIPSRRVP